MEISSQPATRRIFCEAMPYSLERWQKASLRSCPAKPDRIVLGIHPLVASCGLHLSFFCA